jgi:MFS family permease
MPYRWELIVWLSLAFFFNQADRQIFHVVMPLIKAELGLSDVQLGFIASVFSAVLALTVPFAGYAGDAWSRTRIVTWSLLGWSVASFLTGFAPGFLYFVLVRSLATGIGEGFHAPAAYALISQHHKDTRARAMSIHQTSVYAGVVASGALAGYIGQYFGWRSAFWIFGGAGVLVGGLMARRLGVSPAVAVASPGLDLRSAFTILVRTPSALLLSLAFCSMVFVNVASLTWMPTYLHERFAISVGEAGFASMFYLHAAALAGVLVSGRLSDHLALRKPRVRATIQAAGLLGAAPFLFLLSAAADLRQACLALTGAGLFRGVYEANIYAALHDVVAARFHSTASSAMISAAYLAACLAPVALGAVKQEAGLSAGIGWLSALLLPGAAAAFLASRVFYERDHARATAN